MSQLTEQYLAETGEKALYRMNSSDYHTLRYVNWLEKLVEGVREREHDNAMGAIPQCPSCLESRKVSLFWTCERCGERWSADESSVA